mmetsp:Transcript_41206/g.47444  ORF Transcript_41206/g.47444 Transcript_41206/m.47444 type:complete len:247 (-) Transcript_41206:64-804(-)
MDFHSHRLGGLLDLDVLHFQDCLVNRIECWLIEHFDSESLFGSVWLWHFQVGVHFSNVRNELRNEGLEGRIELDSLRLVSSDILEKLFDLAAHFEVRVVRCVVSAWDFFLIVFLDVAIGPCVSFVGFLDERILLVVLLFLSIDFFRIVKVELQVVGLIFNCFCSNNRSLLSAGLLWFIFIEFVGLGEGRLLTVLWVLIELLVVFVILILFHVTIVKLLFSFVKLLLALIELLFSLVVITIFAIVKI